MNVTISHLSYIRTQVGTAASRRQSRAKARNLQDAPTNLLAVTGATLPMVDYPQFAGNTTELYNSFTGVLGESFTSGVFTSTLKDEAVAINASVFVFNDFTTSAVTFDPPQLQFPPSRRPTAMPRYNDGLSNGEVAAFVIVTVVCAGLLVYLVFLVITNFRRHKPASKDDKELFMDGAFEKLDLPDNDDVMIINVGAPLDDVHFNNNIQIYQRDVDSRL